MTRNLVLVVSTLLIVVLLSHPASAQPQSVGEAPFSLDSNRILVQVKINGKGPYSMIIRTGISHSYVDSTVAKETAARVVPLPFVTESDKGEPLGVLVQLKNIEVGSYQRRLLLAIAQDFSKFNASDRWVSAPVQVLLGFSFLRSQAFQIDYPKKIIRFLASAPYDKNDPPQAGVSRFTIPYYVSTDSAFPVIDDVYVGGKKVRALLDTGYGGALALTPRAIKSLGLATSAAVSMKLATAPESSLTFEVVPDDQDKPLGVYGAIIGAKFLSDYILTFDPKRKLVTLEKP